MIVEKPARSWSGYTMFVFLLIAQALTAASVAFIHGPFVLKAVEAIAALFVLVCWIGFFMVNPNEGRVLQLFGQYIGTEKKHGLRWANPLYSKTKVSLRVRNFESGQLKVNDLMGNPVEIAAVIVWRVVDTAEAIFEVDDYEQYVAIQTEAAIRDMATSYAYDDHGDSEISLRGNGNEVADILRGEVQKRLGKAGVEVMEARISHLAYAPEIASAMLQRQQASAIVAARQKIVEGAVGMVELALEALNEKQVVELDEERKAAMVSNLLVVLCGDKAAQPIVNTGTLYN
ncbi:regulator of protease activity HflC (stomatin/prohibitin superfamily) [Alteromonadaceae bacterium 2753L.S.0a.02]|nr:regulator of protease activity HflC (stomatin/prohibitin superfamily) [Alteromonadaceae bacterium 2753L.S.0a.02]